MFDLDINNRGLGEARCSLTLLTESWVWVTQFITKHESSHQPAPAQPPPALARQTCPSFPSWELHSTFKYRNINIFVDNS